MSFNEAEVKMAERVKFWEEQDQMNKELIPRVIKNHELISDMAYQLDKYSNLVAKLRSDFDGLKDYAEKQHNEIKTLIADNRKKSEEIEALKNKILDDSLNKSMEIETLKNTFLEDNRKNSVEMEKLRTKMMDDHKNVMLEIEMLNNVIKEMGHAIKKEPPAANRQAAPLILSAVAIILSIGSIFF